MKALDIEIHPLIERLRCAVRLGDPAVITKRIKDELESFIPADGLLLPEAFRRTRPDSYCRRLFYRDPELGFTALVMTWGPGQATALHDHAGIWCVEGVVEGEMEVTRFDLVDESERGLCRFVEKGKAHARAGSAGALIPPFDYHVLANVNPDRIALSLHVYGGEMNHCSVFLPEPGGLHRRQLKQLSYDA
ncbi:MAG TPA: cysteine dioxygenase family protein [Thermoanaerobaculia bacterium]|nr:cysteine dioxygenase family protein [Thermoanaerobaculia bacterium]